MKNDEKGAVNAQNLSEEESKDDLAGITAEELSIREDACKGKKYGDGCTFTATDGSTQTGKCFYQKLSITTKPLYCAKADYRASEK